jgi:hypothetical protein
MIFPDSPDEYWDSTWKLVMTTLLQTLLKITNYLVLRVGG